MEMMALTCFSAVDSDMNIRPEANSNEPLRTLIRRAQDRRASAERLANIPRAADLGMATVELDRRGVKNCQKVLIVETWEHHP